MTTPTTHQVSLSYFRDISTLNSHPPLLIRAAPPHFTLSSLAHFLSILPASGNRTTADLSSPIFLPSQTCQVKKKSSWVIWHADKISTPQQLVISFSCGSTDEFLPLHWGKTWTPSGPCSRSHPGSEHRGLDKLHTSTDGNVVAGGGCVIQQSQLSGL